MCRAFLFFCLLHQFIVATAYGQDDKQKKEIKFEGKVNLDRQSVSGVKLELKKNGEIIKTVKSSSNGKYELLIDVNTTDPDDAEYVLTFSKNKMLPKTVSINAYIENPRARAYVFNMDVDMIAQKEDDIIIDLPTATIRWSEEDRKFIFDLTHAKTMKREKEEEVPVEKEIVKKPVPTKNAVNTSKPVATKINNIPVSNEKYDIPMGSNLDDEKKKQVQDSLLKKYQKGITEEVFEDTNYNLTKRTVVKDDKVIVYYKKVWAWGGVFYFKDDQSTVRSISENTYNMETIGVK